MTTESSPSRQVQHDQPWPSILCQLLQDDTTLSPPPSAPGEVIRSVSVIVSSGRPVSHEPQSVTADGNRESTLNDGRQRNEAESNSVAPPSAMYNTLSSAAGHTVVSATTESGKDRTGGVFLCSLNDESRNGQQVCIITGDGNVHTAQLLSEAFGAESDEETFSQEPSPSKCVSRSAGAAVQRQRVPQSAAVLHQQLVQERRLHDLINQKKLPSNQKINEKNTGSRFRTGSIDRINTDEISDFAKAFKMKRLSLGITQADVGRMLSLTEGPAYSQSAICRFENLDVTAKAAQNMKRVLEKWMHDIDHNIESRRAPNSDQAQHISPRWLQLPSTSLPSRMMGTLTLPTKLCPSNTTSDIPSHQHPPGGLPVDAIKTRRRRTTFTPEALEIFNRIFQHNTHLSGSDMTMLASVMQMDREVVRVWFCNKRQAVKNTNESTKRRRQSSVDCVNPSADCLSSDPTK